MNMALSNKKQFNAVYVIEYLYQNVAHPKILSRLNNEFLFLKKAKVAQQDMWLFVIFSISYHQVIFSKKKGWITLKLNCF